MGCAGKSGPFFNHGLNHFEALDVPGVLVKLNQKSAQLRHDLKCHLFFAQLVGTDHEGQQTWRTSFRVDLTAVKSELRR